MLLAACPLDRLWPRRLPRRVVFGNVTCGGEKVAFGEVLFVPIEGTRGPATAAVIVDGQYRAENRGGVPIGKHRVEISAQRATGRKVATPEGAMADEAVSIGPASMPAHSPRWPSKSRPTATAGWTLRFPPSRASTRPSAYAPPAA